jgi:hypothetical protein
MKRNMKEQDFAMNKTWERGRRLHHIILSPKLTTATIHQEYYKHSSPWKEYTFYSSVFLSGPGKFGGTTTRDTSGELTFVQLIQTIKQMMKFLIVKTHSRFYINKSMYQGEQFTQTFPSCSGINSINISIKEESKYSFFFLLG